MGIADLYNFDSLSVKPNLNKPLAGYFEESRSVQPVIKPKTVNQYSLKDRGITLSDDDIEAFRPLLYGEVSNRTPDKQALEANVIFNTALNRVKAYNERGQPKTLSEVLALPNQYQAYGGKQYQAYHNPPDVVAAVKKKQIDAIIDNIHSQVKLGQYPDNTQGAYYYVHNPKTGTITYDNAKPLFAKN